MAAEVMVLFGEKLVTCEGTVAKIWYYCRQDSALHKA